MIFQSFQPISSDPGPGGCPVGSPYTIRPGDSIPSIASRLGVSIDQLMALNQNINSQGLLPVGQTICLPNQ